jgi:mRNA interferase YafQ
VRIAVRSGQFRRDVKRARRRGKDMNKLRQLILLLLAGDGLPDRYQDHPLKGNWKGYRDAHIELDWLLIYRVADDDELHLVRTGSHADLFDE